MSAAPPPSADPLADEDERFPDDDQVPLDPSAPPLSLDSARSEYRRMIEYICGLFPRAADVPPSAPLPRALFESFFAPVAPATPSLNFNWFDRARTALMDADTRVASLLAAGRPELLLLPQRVASYAVRGDCSLGRAVPVNESLLAHFDRPLRPNLQLGVTVRNAMALEASFRAQSEALPYSMWVLSGLLGFVRLQDFSPADPALFNQLVTALSKSLAHQAQVTALHTAFLCQCRHEFYLSHLPAYFSDVTKRSMLSSSAVYVDSLFREEDVARLLEATRSSSSLKSQQAMVDVASRLPSASAVRQCRASPSRSPTQRCRQSSGSPSRPSKRVRLDSLAPSSALKSPLICPCLIPSASNLYGILWVLYLGNCLCPVRALQIYLRRTYSLSPCPRSLFVSPRSPSRSLSKNALSFFLRSIILLSIPSSSTPAPSSSRGHSIRAMSTSAAFSRNVPLASILAAAAWSSSTVFTSFYLRDVQFSSASGFSMGPVVAADAVI